MTYIKLYLFLSFRNTKIAVVTYKVIITTNIIVESNKKK